MRKIIIGIVILAVIWALPPVRAYVSTAAVPVLEKMGPVGAAVLKPARRMATKTRVTSIARLVQSDRDEGRRVPEERDFNRWLRERLPDETGLDPWGNAYWMSRRGTSLVVGSSGPDGERGTGDDVTHTIAF